MSYIYWLTIFIWMPLVILWSLNYKYLLRYKGVFTRCIIWSIIFGVLWDFVAVGTHIWFFPPDTNLGIIILGLPLEEYLFIVFTCLYISTATILVRKRLQRKGMI